MTAALGQIVLYPLTEDDAKRIGTQTKAGQIYPAIVVAHSESGRCDLQVFLDGNDTLWVTGVLEEFGRLTGPGFYKVNL